MHATHAERDCEQPLSDATDERLSWYIVRLRPGGLSRAQANLARQDVRTFCPERRRTQRRGGRLVTGLRPLFPGYLFIALAPDTRTSWRSINATYGVAKVVCLEPGRPAQVPQDIVAALKAYCEDDAAPRTAFRPGEDVRIILGPFADMTARIEAVPDRDRIHVLLEMMGRRVRARLRPSDLERAG
jgi:transcriptional antiterminator RfaH